MNLKSLILPLCLMPALASAFNNEIDTLGANQDEQVVISLMLCAKAAYNLGMLEERDTAAKKIMYHMEHVMAPKGIGFSLQSQEIARPAIEAYLHPASMNGKPQSEAHLRTVMADPICKAAFAS